MHRVNTYESKRSPSSSLRSQRESLEMRVSALEARLEALDLPDAAQLPKVLEKKAIFVLQNHEIVLLLLSTTPHFAFVVA